MTAIGLGVMTRFYSFCEAKIKSETGLYTLMVDVTLRTSQTYQIPDT